jgi:hypothetical protein
MVGHKGAQQASNTSPTGSLASLNSAALSLRSGGPIVLPPFLLMSWEAVVGTPLAQLPGGPFISSPSFPRE